MSKPKTVEQWLVIPADDLPTELGRVFTPGQPGKHNLAKAGKNNIEQVRKTGATYQSEWKCSRCKAFFPMGVDDGRYGDCPVPDPITIDWNAAMEWMRKCDRDEFLFAMWKVSNLYPDRNGKREKMLGYCVFIAQPKHYLIAAAMESKDNVRQQ